MVTLTAFFAPIGLALLSYAAKYGLKLLLKVLPLLTLAFVGLLLAFVVGHAGLAWYLRGALSALIFLLAASSFCLGFQVRDEASAAFARRRP